MTEGAVSGGERESPTSVGHFRILGPLGKGGMGVVYRAEDEALRRTVALKLLPGGGERRLADSDEAKQRFLREARSAAAISHPNVAHVHEVGDADGYLYIAMELVQGETLRARLGRGRLDVATARRLAEQVARGLAAAHARGIMHRDLKPENVMVTPDGVVKLLDFGLAKAGDAGDAETPSARADLALAPTQTAVSIDGGRVMGTPAYMSPEQAVGAPLDVRSDVFSFGVVLYEMLSGTRPFDGLTSGAILVAIARDPAPPLRERAPEVDADLEAIVARCLAKAPADRFADAGEIVAAFAGMGALVTEPRGPRGASFATGPSRRVREGGLGHAALRMGAPIAMGLLVLAGWWWAKRTGSPATDGTAVAVSASSASPSASSTPASTQTYAERRVTSLAAEDYVDDAALTPDGKEFVFADDEGFWVQPVAGGARRALGVPRSGAGTVSERAVSMLADGAHVLLSASDGEHLRAWLAPLDGSPARLVHEGTGIDAWASPDGTHLAVASREAAKLEVVPTGGGPAVTVATSSAFAVAFSPDGTHVAFVTSHPATLQVAAIDGSTVARTVVDPSILTFSVAGLAWPDPGRLLFSSRATDEAFCRVSEVAIDADGHPRSPPRELWRMRAQALQGLTAADGRMSVLVTQKRDEVRVAELAPGARRLVAPPRPVTHGEAAVRHLAWLPDGRLSFFSDRDNEPALYAQAVDAKEPTRLVAPPVDASHWRVNQIDALRTGELFYLRPDPVSDAGAARLLLGTPGGKEREVGRVAARDEEAVVHCGAGEPSRCVLGVFRDHAMTLAHVDVATGVVGKPFFHGGRTANFAVSPDGGEVALVEMLPTLTVIDAATGQLRTMTTTPHGRSLQDVAYAADGKTLLVTGQDFDGAPYGLIAVDRDGRGALIQSSTNQFMTEPHVSFDGRRLALVAWVTSTSVWLLEPR